MLPAVFTPSFLSQLELLRVRARRAFLGTRQGGHLSPKRGHGIEFSDYRQYELGDNPRHIDWGVFARTERLYVKRYQEEQELRVMIVLDASASMGVSAGGKKWEMARDLAIALAYIALMEQDTVTIAVPGLRVSPAYVGPRAIHALADALQAIDPSQVPHFDFSEEIRRAATRVRFPGVSIVISDFLMPFATIDSIFRGLRSRNLDLTAIQVLGEEDLRPLAQENSAFVTDSETGKQISVQFTPEVRAEYEQLLTKHNQNLEQYLADGRVGFAQATTMQPLEQFMLESIPRTGLLR